MILTFTGYIDDTSALFLPGERIELSSVDECGALRCRAVDRCDADGEAIVDVVWPEETDVGGRWFWQQREIGRAA